VKACGGARCVRSRWSAPGPRRVYVFGALSVVLSVSPICSGANIDYRGGHEYQRGPRRRAIVIPLSRPNRPLVGLGWRPRALPSFRWVSTRSRLDGHERPLLGLQLGPSPPALATPRHPLRESSQAAEDPRIIATKFSPRG
jgi:hypothetical protein